PPRPCSARTRCSVETGASACIASSAAASTACRSAAAVRPSQREATASRSSPGSVGRLASATARIARRAAASGRPTWRLRSKRGGGEGGRELLRIGADRGRADLDEPERELAGECAREVRLADAGGAVQEEAVPVDSVLVGPVGEGEQEPERRLRLLLDRVHAAQ